jgi:hypothetical protein
MGQDGAKQFTGDKVRDIRSGKHRFLHLVPARPALESGCTDSDPALPQLSTSPLTDPTEILRRLPTQAISPALLVLLDTLSSPILLIEDNPSGERREAQPAPLRKAA